MKQYKQFTIAFIALLFFSIFFVPNGSQATTAVSNVQPQLYELATTSPTTPVSVIVQATGDRAALQAHVTALGGKVTQELTIINAFVADVSAETAVLLARDQAVRWVSLNSSVISTSDSDGEQSTSSNSYLQTLNVDDLAGSGLDGSNIVVAVIDSGVSRNSDLGRMQAVVINDATNNTKDYLGHGTHIAGIIQSNGQSSNGAYQGIAPGVDLVSIKISNNQGIANEADAIAAMQWVYDHRDSHHIRIVNLSLSASLAQSYHNSPLNAAAEILWFNNIVVVASAGNVSQSNPDPINYPPANDPFIITVGASDEQGTASRADDTIASFSAYGMTLDGFVKPDIIAPGVNIISNLSPYSSWGQEHPDHVVGDGNDYIRLNGTSMAAPMVTGVTALLLQDEPDLTADQVKYRLMHSGSTLPGQTGDPNAYTYLDAQAVINGTSSESMNTGTAVSQLLFTGDDPVNWNSVNWGSVNWGSVNWGSVNWGSVNWGSVNWGVAWDN